MDKAKWKEILWKILFPGTGWIFLLVNVSAVLLIYAFLGENCPAAVAYVSYVLSAYALVVVCARIPDMIKNGRNRLHSNKYVDIYLTDSELRIRSSLYRGLVLNFGFASFKVVMGIMYQSKWLLAMAGYNMILSGMRFMLAYRDQKDKKEKDEAERRLRGLRSYKVCSWLMLLLNLAIYVIVVIVVMDKQTIHYPGFMIYAIAAFTFYCLIMAIINMGKYRRRENPVFSAIIRIDGAKAFVSVFTLQVAMLTQFGSADVHVNRLANAATGTAVCVSITIMAVLMLKGVKQDYQSIANITKEEKTV